MNRLVERGFVVLAGHSSVAAVVYFVSCNIEAGAKVDNLRIERGKARMHSERDESRNPR